MLFTIHVHYVPNTPHTHYGYVCKLGELRSHEQIKALSGDDAKAKTFQTWDDAYQFLLATGFLETDGKILIEPLPESGPQEILAFEYLQFCHKYKANFM